MPNPTLDLPTSDAWWAVPAAGWSEMLDTTYERWNRFDRSKPKIDKDVAVGAMEFGFASRTFYGEHRAWDDLKDQLEVDWRTAGREGEHPWKHVRNAVKAGWTAAGVSAEAGRAGPPRSELPPIDPSDRSDSRNVPGGRPDGQRSDNRSAEDEDREPHVPGGRME